MKHARTAAMAAALVLAVAGMLWAGGVLPVMDATPEQVVGARKAMMKAIKSNMKDIGSKFESGALADIPANASALEVLGRLMPTLYGKKHESAYSGKGSYFTGAAPADFESAAEQFRAAVEQVQTAAAAGNKAAVGDAMAAAQKSCGACHNAYRGKF